MIERTRRHRITRLWRGFNIALFLALVIFAARAEIAAMLGLP